MLWIEAFHLISLICWFAALFYLPRLFVYHASSKDAASIEHFKIMERKLYRGIMTPSAIATIIFGVWLITYNPSYYMHAGWFYAKLALVLVLLGYHYACNRLLKKFAEDCNTNSHIFYRWFNELPTFLLISIIILAIVKPF